MLAAIRGDRNPNLLVLQYTREWMVKNLLIIPSFFFVESCIEKRKPLAMTARRAGWIGCNVLLSAVAPEGKLRIVADSRAEDQRVVRSQYARLRPISGLSVELRGWTLDVLRVLRALPQTTFTLADVYAHENKLAALHPSNRNIRPKIRQQLQVLRDLELLEFVGRGRYSLSQL